MSPTRWVDADGQLCPTRPCPTCGRVIPDPTVAGVAHRGDSASPLEVIGVVQWCGHLRELVVVPDGPDWFTEIPVLGIAT
jgi:hypothetical protein